MLAMRNAWQARQDLAANRAQSEKVLRELARLKGEIAAKEVAASPPSSPSPPSFALTRPR
jgi:hypothetical protein